MFKISLDALNLLDAIDRQGSFAGAAKELFRVPSAVSYTVQKLEENMDVKLFVRNGPKISLTRAGAELLKEGRVLMQAAAELENRVQRVASGWETELRIGVNTMFSSLCLKDDLQAFHQETSQTGIRISEEVLSGQSSITVPNLLSKFEYQMAGLGFGFLPAPYVEEAVRQRLLVEMEVSIPKPIETLYVAWRHDRQQGQRTR